MRFYPTRFHLAFVCLVFLSILLNLACNKERDSLFDSLLDDKPISNIKDRDAAETATEEESSETGEETTTGEVSENTTELESRIISFSPIHDAHLQMGRGYNQNIIKLEEDNRTSYLMFDMTPIEFIGGSLSKASLQFTINSDDGSGNINVFRGQSSNWTEEELSDTTAPEIDLLIGSITKEYHIGITEIIELDASDMSPEVTTLVLNHKNGNDLAFASKEHTSKIGPKLVVTYEVPVGTEEIVITEEEVATTEETTEEDTIQNKEPMAIADATPSSGGVPLKVTFKGSSSSDDSEITEYTWDFKDGSGASSVNPTHTFTDVGVYEVELTVKDEQGLSNTDKVTITVNEEENKAPTAIIDATPVTGEAPLEVSFSGSDSTDDRAISSYVWDLKNGSSANTADFTYTYDDPGTYEVELTVKDENGLEDTKSITITVEEPSTTPPVAVMSANPSSGPAPLAVQFVGDNSTDDNGVTSYFWDLKDGKQTKTINPFHIFSNAGTYEVELTVEDEEGLSSTEKITITVTAAENEAPIAKISADKTSGEAPLVVRFVGDQSTDDKVVTSYFWDLKDGKQTRTINPSHTFSNPGTYEVELTVEDAEGLSSTETITIIVDGAQGGGNNGSYPSDAVYVSSYGFNASDATNAMKEAIKSSHSFIVVDKQSSDWIVEPLNFKNIRNKTIVFESGVVLRAKRGAFPEAHRLLQFTYSDNVKILGYGATFQMNKSEYTSGEQRHTLSFVNSSNMTAKGLTLKDSGGDGIYISRFNDGEYCRNILIEDIVSTNNKRLGMSVISVDGLTVRNSSFTNTRGTAPGAGVDFEPESTRDRLVGIRFNGCSFTGNQGSGILFALGKTSASNMPLDAIFTDTYVSNNFISPNPGYPSEIELGMSTNKANPIKGNIVFDGLRVENSKWSGIWSKKTLETYHITVKNAVIKNVSKASDLAAIHVGLLSYGNTSYANMGGYTFENVLIDYDGVDASLELFGPSHGNWNLREMRGTIRVKSPRGIRLEDNLNRLSNNSSSTVNLRVIAD